MPIEFKITTHKQDEKELEPISDSDYRQNWISTVKAAISQGLSPKSTLLKSIIDRFLIAPEECGFHVNSWEELGVKPKTS